MPTLLPNYGTNVLIGVWGNQLSVSEAPPINFTLESIQLLVVSI